MSSELIPKVPPSRRLMIGFLPGYATNAKRRYSISSVPGDQLNYLVYAFAGFAQDGAVWKVTTPEPKDTTKNFPKLQALKLQYPNLRLMISVGGWNHSHIPAPGGGTAISAIAASAPARVAYVRSCLDTFIHTSSLRFDGIDLDWEFPAAADVTNFAALAHEFRTQLNDAGRADGTHYLFSASVGINPDTYVGINPDGTKKWAEVQHSFDWLNLMTYNMNVPLANPGQSLTRFNAPLYPSPAEPVPPGPNVDAAVQAYLNAGVVPGKIVVGVDAYARSYAGVGTANGGLYQPYTGIGPGTWDRGYLSYQDVFENYLSLSGAPGWDDTTKSTSMYIPSERVWISPQMDGDVIAKSIYVVKNRLGGVMLWELGADMTDENSLLGYIATALRNTPD